MLSDAASRQHYLEAPRRDWRAFFDACGDDPVIEEMKVLLDLLDPTSAIVLLTARPERIHHLTEAWLHRYRIRWDVLIMRRLGRLRDVARLQAGDRRASCAATASTCSSRSRTTAATSRCSAREGVPCVYFHSGYYD